MAGKTKYKSIFSLKEWEKHLPILSDFTPERIEACKRVMVEGEAPTQVAKSIGHSRQWLTEALGKVYNKIYTSIPDGWVTVTVVVPPELENSIRGMADKALQHANRNLTRIDT